jgi:hypothetical protein
VRRKKTEDAHRWIELRVPEARRFFQEQQAHRLQWSRFRRQHQKRAQDFHGCAALAKRLLGVPALTDEQWEHMSTCSCHDRNRRGRRQDAQPSITA